LEGGCHETLWVWGGFPVPVGHHRKTGIEEGEELVDRQDRFELDHTAAFSSLRVPTTLYSAPSKLPRAMWIWFRKLPTFSKTPNSRHDIEEHSKSTVLKADKTA
jgi:hypothetical protein